MGYLCITNSYHNNVSTHAGTVAIKTRNISLQLRNKYTDTDSLYDNK